MGSTPREETKEQVWASQGGGSGTAALSLALREKHLAAFQSGWCRATNHNRCPCERSLKFPAPCTGMISHSYTPVLRRFRCLLRTHRTHAGTRTCPELALPHSEQRGARLLLAAAPSSSCIWAGAQLHRGTGREHREVLLASTPTSIPTPDSHSQGRSGPSTLNRFHPFFDGNGRLFTKTTSHQPAVLKLRC